MIKNILWKIIIFVNVTGVLGIFLTLSSIFIKGNSNINIPIILTLLSTVVIYDLLVIIAMIGGGRK
jgi:hypothetical protein